jgi:endonuclease YncB( thermonuclease family)
VSKGILVLLLFCSLAHADFTGRVVAVIDGDTIEVLAGMAWWFRHYADEFSPEDRGRYESAEGEARARGWGLWADPNPVNPYKWRQIPTYEHPNEER